MSRPKVLITGGAGFVGSHIADLASKHADVRILDNFRSGFRANLQGIPHELIEGSIEDNGILSDAMSGIDYVFHLAAMISVPESMLNPSECVTVNTLGTLNVLEAAAQAGVKKLVLSSTAAIYGDDPTMPKCESLPPCPKSPYAVTKLDGEYYCAMFTALGRLDTACLRYFNVFGPRQNPKSAYAAAIPIFLSRALSGNDVTIYGDGGQTRDFVHVSDIAGANWHAATTPGMTGVYNVACGKSLSIRELAEQIVKTTGSMSKLVFQPERLGDIRHSIADVTRLTTAGYVCNSDFDMLLASTAESYRR
ncbi:MAG: NAD-dependent epimerase/dehydratase family protein [Armatimonadota bacterium]